MVFKDKKEKKVQTYDILTLLGIEAREQKGEVGIEIEVEGTNIPKFDDIPTPWKYKEDHSLRGVDNAEYVLKGPIEFSMVPDALDRLWKVFREFNTKFDDSNRTSVHVHLNCQRFFIPRVATLMALYIVLEEVLTEWCGDHRVGNLFCLRSKDAPAIVSSISHFMKNNGNYSLSDGLHYAGMSAYSLRKFGSLEFRSLRGVSDPKIIQEWIDILHRLYTLSGEMKDPREVCHMFSSSGPLAFFENILGDMAMTVLNRVEMNQDQVRSSMYEGVRLAQDLCYATDWSQFQCIELKKDPFGRSKKKISQTLASLESQLEGYTPFVTGAAPPAPQWVATSFEPFVTQDEESENYFEEDE